MLTVLTALQKCFPAFNLILMIEYRFTDTGIHERRNKMKKFAALIAGVTALTLLAGCGGETNPSFNKETAAKIGDTGGLKLPLSDKNETIEWSVVSDHEDFNNSYVATKLREITGVDVQFRIVPAATAEEKLNVWIASKDLPDIIGNGFEITKANELARQGAFAAVEDYIDKLPNFKATFVDNKDNDWIFKSYAAGDGKLYGFYGYDWNRDVNTGATMYRKDIFDKHGLTMWNSPDEFYTVLKKLKELYPSSTPYTSKAKDDLFQTLGYSWGIVPFKPYYDETAKVWKYSDTDPAYKDMLDYMKKLYDEKLIDPEFLTNTQAAWTAKMTQPDKAFVTTDWIGRMDMFKEQATMVPDYDLRFGNPIGPKQTMKTLDQICWARYVANNDKAETAFKLLDFCLSPAGAELITMGIEGETYVLDENGMAKYIEFPEGEKVDMSKLLQKYGMFTEGMYLKFDRRSIYFQFTEREQEAQDFAKDPSHMEPMDPILPFTAEEQKAVNDYMTKLDTAGREFASKYIVANETGESAWNAWIQKAESLGASEMVKIYNEAQKRYDAN